MQITQLHVFIYLSQDSISVSLTGKNRKCVHHFFFQWMGHWYMISRIVPCQWPGSKDFTDFRMYQCMEGKSGNVLTEDSWRFVNAHIAIPGTPMPMISIVSWS